MSRSHHLAEVSRAASAPCLIWRCAVVVLVAWVGPAAGQEDKVELPIYEQEPFDRIVLKETEEGEEGEEGDVVYVTPVASLREPGARDANTRAAKDLEVELLDRPDERFTLAWRDISEFRLFEEMVLDQANRWVESSNFDEAFRALDFLRKRYPQTPQLDSVIDRFLLKNAAALYSDGAYEHALALLWEVYRRNPQRRELPAAVARVGGKLIERHVAEEQYAAARDLIERFSGMFAGREARLDAEWTQRFERHAAELLSQARTAREAKRYGEAKQKCSQALRAWPNLKAAEVFARELHEKHPAVVVGVTLSAAGPATDRLDDWAARRSERLFMRNLFELVGYDADGGNYVCPLGDIRIDESGRSLTIELRGERRAARTRMIKTGNDLAQYVISCVDSTGSGGDSAYRDVVAAVSVRDVYRVEVELARQLVRPQAVLASMLRRPNAGQPLVPGPYRVEERTPQEVRYALQWLDPLSETNRPSEIVERTYEDGDSLVRALASGAVDAIDLVPPWHVPALAASDEFEVRRYALPTAHVLIPNLQRPQMRSPSLRRALVYGINRQAILDKDILRGQAEAGCRLLSGPFPTGMSGDHPIGFAADPQLEPRPYEPRLALVLGTMARWELAPARDGNEKQPQPGPAKKEPAKKEPLVLAHPAEPVAQIACLRISEQLERVGIPVVLHQLAAGELATGSPAYDLLYAELAMWEPLVDARRLLGDRGLTGRCSSYMSLALSRLDLATDWVDIRNRLREVHRAAYSEVTVVPLWQTVRHFAYRDEIQGIGQGPVTFYQHVEKWNLE